MNYLFRATAPSTFAQMSTWRSAKAPQIHTACVECGAITTQRDWCNACQERLLEASRKRFPGYSRAVLMAKMKASTSECDCGLDKPRLARRCSRCAWMEREEDQ
jgi:hypothetical protein